MSSLATTRLSSKGQVVIPEEIRQRLGLKEGTQFVVVGDRDVVILKSIAPPALGEFDELVALSPRGRAPGWPEADRCAPRPRQGRSDRVR